MFVQQNSVKAISDYYFSALKEIYPPEEINSIVYIVFEKFKKWSKAELKLHFSEGLSESELLQFHWVLKRLKKCEPIQYILEETEFFGLPFKVNKNVLIPRQETEELVDLIRQNCKGNEIILDIGTGSGIIPVSLKKKMPGTTVFGLDVSEDAIEVAASNAALNQVEVAFIKKNVLDMTDLNFVEGKLDVIVSNPPYITQKEKSLMHKNVLDFEPEIALFVDNDDPLLFYRKITQLADDALLSGGQLFFEINENYGPETVRLVQSHNFSKVTLLQDLNNKDRMLHAVK